MQQTLYFRSSIFEYWKFILAHWQETPISPLKIPANYVPKVNEMIPFAFYDEKHLGIISVFADANIGKNLVTLTVFYSDEAFEKRGKSAVAMWNKLRKTMERKDLLIDPTAQIQQRVVKRKKPAKPKIGSHLNHWFDYYHDMRAAQFNYTFKDLSRDSGHTAGHLANMHGNYKKERGLT